MFLVDYIFCFGYIVILNLMIKKSNLEDWTTEVFCYCFKWFVLYLCFMVSVYIVLHVPNRTTNVYRYNLIIAFNWVYVGLCFIYFFALSFMYPRITKQLNRVQYMMFRKIIFTSINLIYILFFLTLVLLG